MGVIRTLERGLEGLVEGVFARLFKSRAHPDEIARRLESEMERSQVVRGGEPLVANRFAVDLSPGDYDAVSGMLENLTREWRRQLEDVLAREAFEVIGPVSVLVSANPRVGPGRCRIQARMVEGFPRIRVSVIAGPVAGLVFELEGPSLGIGRSSENEIWLDDADLSRRHARLEADGHLYRLIDLGSTNGTFVNGNRVSHCRVRDGDRIEIGSSILEVHME